MQIPRKHMERCSSSLFVSKVKTTTTIKFYTPIRMTEVKTVHSYTGENVEQLEPSYTAKGM